MDRFESFLLIQLSLSFFHLHSNMDRFESAEIGCFSRKWYFIYIPIWIDLKVILQNNSVDFEQIYIPIWIDLKATGFCVGCMGLSYLHSNMDRFERAVKSSVSEVKSEFTFQYG